MLKLTDEKIALIIKWNIMLIVYGTPKGRVRKLCLTENFSDFEHFNDKHLLNKKLGFISKYRHENRQLLKSAEKG